MTNVALLREHMERNRYGVRSLSKDSGISEPSLFNKLSGKYEFKAGEIEAVAKCLHLNAEELVEVFFTDCVGK